MSFSYTFEAMPQVFTDWGHVIALPVPEEVVAAAKGEKVKRFICALNDGFEMPCALQAQKGGARYIMLSKRIQAESEIDFTGPVQVTLTEDDSEYGYPVPEEWQAILDFDEEAAEYFHRLTPGRQRSVLHLVSSPKREATRIDRALRIAENLKLGVKNPQDFLKRF